MDYLRNGQDLKNNTCRLMSDIRADAKQNLKV